MSSTGSEPLFADLPIQPAPTILTCDTHVLEPCRRCAGTGREACPYPRHYNVAQTWDPTCRGCGGAGAHLIKRWHVHGG